MDEMIDTNENGAPSMQVPAVLDWLDQKISIQVEAQSGMTDTTALAFLMGTVDLLEEMKSDLTTATLETMDAHPATA